MTQRNVNKLDSVYNSYLVNFFINYFIIYGKKEKTETIVYSLLRKNGLILFFEIIDSGKFLFDFYKRHRGEKKRRRETLVPILLFSTSYSYKISLKLFIKAIKMQNVQPGLNMFKRKFSAELQNFKIVAGLTFLHEHYQIKNFYELAVLNRKNLHYRWE